MIPAEPKGRIRAKRLQNWIYIKDKTWNELLDLARELSVDAPLEY